jgi:hypothetical protein
LSQSEENIEIDHSSPVIVAKEIAILRIGNIRMHLERIEVIGQVTDCTGEPHCVFGVDLDVFRNSQVEREVSWETRLRTVGCRDVLLVYVGGLVGKAVTKLHVWRYRDLFWKSIRAPQQKPIGNFTGQTCCKAIAHDRERIISEVGVGVADIAIGILPNVGKEKLAIGSSSYPRRKLGCRVCAEPDAPSTKAFWN